MKNDDINPEGFIIINYQEWQYTALGNNPSFENIVDYVNKKNIPLYVLNGSAEDSIPLHDVTNFRYKNVILVFFPFYFLIHWTRLYFDIYKKVIDLDKEYDYLFSSFNFKVHSHRLCQMDMLSKYNLLERSAFTWHGVDADNNQTLIYNTEYQPQFWKPEYRVLDTRENYLNIGFGVEIPNEYKYSFMQVVSESTTKVKFITEKTVLPLFWGKIFLVSGAPGFHRYLQKLGFQLYDELFDYSFDDVEDLKTRCDLIAKNVDLYKNCSPDELKDLRNSVLSKIEYNQNKLLSIVKDLSLWSKFITDLCEQDHPSISLEEICFWYKEIKNDA